MSDQPDVSAIPAAGARRRVLLLAAAAAVLVYVLDQLTKWWVVSTMEPGRRVPVVDGLLWWQFIRNPGAAFSLGEDITWVFSVVMAVVSVLIVLTLRRVRSLPWALGLGLVLGGALGNLTDRLLREPGFGVGHVVDFIAVPRFAIFNVADCGVVVGVGIVVALTLLGRELDGTRSRPGAEGAAAVGDGTEEAAGEDRREAPGDGAGAPEEGARG
ncbi:signal peptidase II [Kocuria sp. M1R5S2]|uniref:signal peptidase II n=1 Tax=Kocuria rhizosphaerae TaxID=3376285 RepID=UPI0037B33198